MQVEKFLIELFSGPVSTFWAQAESLTLGCFSSLLIPIFLSLSLRVQGEAQQESSTFERKNKGGYNVFIPL